MMSPALHGVVLTGSTANNGIQQTNTGTTTLRTVTGADEVIRYGGNSGRAFVFVFELPRLGAVAALLQNTEFRFVLSENGMESVPLTVNGNDVFSFGTTPTFYIDLYGLGVRTASTVLTGDAYFSAAHDPDATLRMADFPTPATPVGTTMFSAANLDAYLNAQYAGGTNAGSFVFLRLNPDTEVSAVLNTQRYRVATTDNTSTLLPYHTGHRSRAVRPATFPEQPRQPARPGFNTRPGVF